MTTATRVKRRFCVGGAVLAVALFVGAFNRNSFVGSICVIVLGGFAGLGFATWTLFPFTQPGNDGRGFLRHSYESYHALRQPVPDPEDFT